MSHYIYMLFDMYSTKSPGGLPCRTTKGLVMSDEYDNNQNENAEPQSSEENTADGRPLGYWLRTVDAYLSREFARAFEDEEVSRREWMLLNAVAGDVKVPGFAERIARRGKRLRSLEDRGWVEETGDGTWVLTDEGRAAKERLGAIVDGIRSRVAGAVSPEDFATTVASLEAIARELGWSEEERAARMGFGRGFGPGGRRGFGPGFGPRFGPRPFGPDAREGFGPRAFGPRGFGPGFGSGFRPEDAERFAQHFAEHFAHHAHDEWQGRGHGRDDWHGRGRSHGDRGHHRGEGHGHHGHGRPGAGHGAESAYERGFEAGFTRGQSAS